VRNQVQFQFDTRFGPGWWSDPSLRLLYSQTYNAWKSNSADPSKIFKTYPFAVRMTVDSMTLDARIRKLPEVMAAKIMRKGVKNAMMIWRSALRGLYGKHRSAKIRQHLADNIAVHSRQYRRGKQRKIWGATGVRMGDATAAAVARAFRQGARRGQTRVASDVIELPGRRLHFFEGGTKRWVGRRYFDHVMAATRSQVQAEIANSVNRAVREVFR